MGGLAVCLTCLRQCGRLMPNVPSPAGPTQCTCSSQLKILVIWSGWFVGPCLVSLALPFLSRPGRSPVTIWVRVVSALCTIVVDQDFKELPA